MPVLQVAPPREQILDRKDYMKHYMSSNPERVELYHRNQVISRAIRLGRLPAKRSIQRYSITTHELRAIMDSMITDQTSSRSNG